MRLQNLLIILLVVSVASCEGIIQGKGKIVSASNELPIDSVKINWFDKTVYSDKNGDFSFDEFVGCVPSCPDLELILTKQGYQPKYVNLTKENENHKSVFQLVPNKDFIVDLSHKKPKTFLFYLSITTSIISLLTLVALAIIKVKNKPVWFVIILFGTVAFFYNYLEKSIELRIFRPSIFVFVKYTFEPTWYQLNFPIGLIIFWTYYFYQKKNKIRTNATYNTSIATSGA
jgi:hypothetical protein